MGDDQYSDKEAHVRFLKSLKAAVNTPPKPLKSMTPKRKTKQRKTEQKSK